MGSNFPTKIYLLDQSEQLHGLGWFEAGTLKIGVFLNMCKEVPTKNIPPSLPWNHTRTVDSSIFWGYHNARTCSPHICSQLYGNYSSSKPTALLILQIVLPWIGLRSPFGSEFNRELRLQNGTNDWIHGYSRRFAGVDRRGHLSCPETPTAGCRLRIQLERSLEKRVESAGRAETGWIVRGECGVGCCEWVLSGWAITSEVAFAG